MSNAEAPLRWPRTLYGRVVLVLVAGMLAAQLLTGTIWFDVRYERVQEIPARLAGARIAQALKTLDASTDRAQALGILRAADFSIGPLAQAPSEPVRDAKRHDVERLIADTVALQSGAPRELHLRDVRLFDDENHEGERRAMYTAHHPYSSFLVDARGFDGTWYRIRVTEGQAGLHQRPLEAFGEYALRVYGLRTVLILLLALLLVRWLTRPLTRLSQAAKTLGRDLGAPPLPVTGPAEVRDAAEAFNQMQRRLARAIAYRDELLAAVSHDLRTPITRMRLRTELIDDAPARERLRAELAQMQALVDSILDYLAAGASPGPLHTVDLGALVRAVVEDAREVGHDVRYESVGGVIVQGDTQGLRRALTNLLDNAVRYGRRARVHLDGHCIVVDDDGPGIPAEALERVMEPFFRLERSHRPGTEGTGLGLSIARQLVRAQGGELVLSNRETDGSISGLRVVVALAG